VFFFQAEDGIRDFHVTGVQTCALPILLVQYMPVLSRRKLLSPGMFSGDFFRSALSFSFPLMAAEISWVVLDSGDRFFVQHYLGEIGRASCRERVYMVVVAGGVV